MKIKVHAFETVQAVLLFGVSTWFTCERFGELAGDGLRAMLPFLLLGVGFELTRVSLWIRYCLEREKLYKWVAIFLTGLSIVASLSKITANLEAVGNSGQNEMRMVRVQETIVEGYDEQIQILLDRLKETPKDYVTAARRLQEQIDGLMVKRNEALVKGSEAAENAAKEELVAKKRDMFDVLGAVFGFKDALVKLLRMIFLGLVTVGSEIGLLISSKAAVEKKEEQVEEVRTIENSSSVSEGLLADVLCRAKRKGARPVPSLDTIIQAGISMGKEDYKKLVEKLWVRGVVYRRGGRYWFGSETEREDIEEVLNEKT